MKSPKNAARALAGVTFALTLTGWGCLSMQSQTSLDGGGNTTTNTSTQPYVEAYIEYPGPQAKWAGPMSYILHVSAKDSGAAQITTTPQLLTDEPKAEHESHEAPSVSQRAPAASAVSQAIAPAIHHMSSEDARAQLAHLVSALQGVQAPFRGCMTPVRVRLVRADGGIFERQGCRSELGWSRTVSETVSAFVEASLHGAPAPAVPTAPVAPSIPTAPALSAPKEAQQTPAATTHEATRAVASEH